jgi:hypothetical protein
MDDARVADVIDLTGNHMEANDLRREAAEMVKAQRTLVEMRHCYDFATVGRFMAADLPRLFDTRWSSSFSTSC